MKLYIILPIFNEVLNIETLIKSIDETCFESKIDYQVLAVDDGSTDGSGELLSKLAIDFPVEIITHKRNRGLGETIRDGFEAAADIAKPADILLRMDSDCTHEPKYIPALIAAIVQGADVAIASRFPEGGGQDGLNSNRKWISKIANFSFRFCFPLGGLQEYTCGYRAYKASKFTECLEQYGNSFIQLRGLGFCCTVEKLLKLHLMGARIVEVPFILRYDLKHGASKMAFDVTTLGYIVMVILYHWPRNGWKASAKRHIKEITHT